MYIRCGRPVMPILAAKLKDFAGPQSHLDHNRADVTEDWRRCLQIFMFLVKGKRSLSSLLMQELHSSPEEWTLLDQFLLHSNPKDLPQTRQVAVNCGGAPLLLDASLLEAADHLGGDLVQVLPAKSRLQIPYAA